MSLDPQAPIGVPRVTVAFLLYNAESEVPGLLDSLASQRHAQLANQSAWLVAWLVDDASRDGTVAVVRHGLRERGEPKHIRVVTHSRNLGLAGTLNEVFGAVETPFVLTCHLDCRFGSEDYVAGMLDLMDRYPDAGAITGQPTLQAELRLPFAEKLNVVTNLMDVVPAPGHQELVPVGFAEGRCDIFRVEAVRQVGLYDTQLRVSGEDQVLAARLRAKGYSIYQAPRLAYQLSVSDEQNSVAKLLRHQRLFGRTSPYILLVPGSVAGLVGPYAGANRTRRALLRVTQLLGGAVWPLVACAVVARWPSWTWLAPLALVVLAKLALLARHLVAVRFSAVEWLGFVALQPALDLVYAAGFLEGLGRVALGRNDPIG